MKKLFITLLAGVLFILPLSAFEHGPEFGVGVVGSIKPYTYESAAYKLKWDNFAIDMGARVLENVVPSSNEPIIMFEPGINIYTGTEDAQFYLGGGMFVNIGRGTTETAISGYFRTGCTFGNWDWGTGKGGMDIGLEASPTIFIPDSENEAEVAVGAIFGTLFNILKLNVGVTYFLPL